MKKEFALWIGSRFFSNFGKQIQITAVAWQIFQLTRDPLALGWLGLAQAIPFVGMALWAGHLVDRNEKRKFIIRSEAGLLLSSAGLFLTTFLPHPPLLLLYFIVGFASLCASFENTSTSAYGQLLIPKEKFPRAMGWTLGSFQAALISGPITAGWLLSHWNSRVIYMISGSLLLFSLFLASLLKPIHVSSQVTNESGVERVKQGLRFIRSQPLILASMMLDMVAVLFGDVVALYPFFADSFQAGSLGFGVLKAAPGIGSASVATVQAMRPFVRPTWTTLRTVVSIFGLCIIAFALAPNIYLAALFLVVGGASDGMSVIVRQSIYQALTPDHLRGRVASVSSIFIVTSNEIGEFESGLVARLIGVVPSVLIGGTICLLSVAVMSRLFRGKIEAS